MAKKASKKREKSGRVRTIRVPVAEVISGGTKQEFYRDLRESLDVARRCANKTIAVCLKQDQDLMTGGRPPKLYAYPETSREFIGAAEDPVLLAVDNQAKTRLTAREKYFHTLFSDYRVDLKTRKEVFEAKEVIAWLREVGWLGNAGNLSQIAQVLDVSPESSGCEPPPGSPREPVAIEPPDLSQKAVNSRGFQGSNLAAPEVDDRTI